MARITNENFSGAVFGPQPLPDLSKLSFVSCDFSGARFARCNLTSSVFRNCVFIQADFLEADLTAADFRGSSLREAQLNTAVLRRTQLWGADLARADLTDAVFDHTGLSRRDLGRRLLQEHSADYEAARLIYFRLKENFQDIGAYDDAGWAYLRERAAERRSFAPIRALRSHIRYREHRQEDEVDERLRAMSPATALALRAHYLLKWLSALLQEYVWGYGQRPVRVFGFLAVALLSFAAVYAAIGGVQGSAAREPSFSDLVLYSLASLTSLSVADLAPVSRPAQVVTALEGLIGVAALALFTTALAQRMGGR
jgi:uncharacterized protein YjbI with pentapeptide repeats